MACTIVVSGLFEDDDFHRACEIGAELCAALLKEDQKEELKEEQKEVAQEPDVVYTLEVKAMLEPDWEVYLAKLQVLVGGRCLGHLKSPLVYLKTGDRRIYVGGRKELEALASEHLGREAQAPKTSNAKTAFLEALKATGNRFVFLDIQLGKEKPRKVVIELFDSVCPKTCEAFRRLCTGEDGVDESTKVRLHYRDAPFHRVVKDSWVQSGDIVNGSGDSQIGRSFADECFAVKFDSPGIVAMANRGAPHTNFSQFFITQCALPDLQKKSVGFGRVVFGMKVIRTLNNLETHNERPVEPVKIANSGEIDLRNGFGL